MELALVLVRLDHVATGSEAVVAAESAKTPQQLASDSFRQDEFIK